MKHISSLNLKLIKNDYFWLILLTVIKESYVPLWSFSKRAAPRHLELTIDVLEQNKTKFVNLNENTHRSTQRNFKILISSKIIGF